MCDSSVMCDSDERESQAECLTELIWAGDHEAVERYIRENEITPNAGFYQLRDRCNPPNPVSLACECGNIAMIQTLLDLNFPAYERYSSDDYSTPIHVACSKGNMEVVQLLVEDYGVDITEYPCTGALHRAAENGQVAVLEYFLERGVCVDLSDDDQGSSPLHRAAAAHDQAETCKFLLSRGADVDNEDFERNTPLMYAAQNKSYASARLLLEAGASQNMCNIDDRTAFLWAAENRDIEMMELLLSFGADPEYEDEHLVSPLHHVVFMNWYDGAYFLVNKLNVRVKPPTCYGDRKYAVCTLALSTGYYDIVKLLFNAGYNPSKELALHAPVTGEEENMVKLQELREMVTRPRPLFSLCILTVRRLLGRRLPVDMERLPLPDIVKQEIISCGVKKQES